MYKVNYLNHVEYTIFKINQMSYFLVIIIPVANRYGSWTAVIRVKVALRNDPMT